MNADITRDDYDLGENGTPAFLLFYGVMAIGGGGRSVKVLGWEDTTFEMISIVRSEALRSRACCRARHFVVVC